MPIIIDRDHEKTGRKIARKAEPDKQLVRFLCSAMQVTRAIGKGESFGFDWSDVASDLQTALTIATALAEKEGSQCSS